MVSVVPPLWVRRLARPGTPPEGGDSAGGWVLGSPAGPSPPEQHVEPGDNAGSRGGVSGSPHTFLFFIFSRKLAGAPAASSGVVVGSDQGPHWSLVLLSSGSQPCLGKTGLGGQGTSSSPTCFPSPWRVSQCLRGLLWPFTLPPVSMQVHQLDPKRHPALLPAPAPHASNSVAQPLPASTLVCLLPNRGCPPGMPLLRFSLLGGSASSLLLWVPPQVLLLRPPSCHPAGAAFRLCTLSSRPHLLLFRSGALRSTWHTFPPVRSATTHHSGPCCPLPAPTGFLFPCRACFCSVFKCVFAPPAWPRAPHGVAKAPLFGPPTDTPQGPVETGRSGSWTASCPHHPLRSWELCRRPRAVVSTEKPGFRTVPRSSPCRPPGRRAAGPGW